MTKKPTLDSETQELIQRLLQYDRALFKNGSATVRYCVQKVYHELLLGINTKSKPKQ